MKTGRMNQLEAMVTVSRSSGVLIVVNKTMKIF